MPPTQSLGATYSHPPPQSHQLEARPPPPLTSCAFPQTPLQPHHHQLLSLLNSAKMLPLEIPPLTHPATTAAPHPRPRAPPSHLPPTLNERQQTARSPRHAWPRSQAGRARLSWPADGVAVGAPRGARCRPPAPVRQLVSARSASAAGRCGWRLRWRGRRLAGRAWAGRAGAGIEESRVLVGVDGTAGSSWHWRGGYRRGPRTMLAFVVVERWMWLVSERWWWFILAPDEPNRWRREFAGRA